jgi:microcystin-dependent protein
MNKRHILIAVGLTSIGGLAGFGFKALADGIPSPNPLYYSGTLTVNGTRAITVNLWPDGTTMGSPLCTTVASTASVLNGRFRIALATTCKAIINQNNGVYVEVIDGATSLGRSPIGAVPYAVEADHAVNADNATNATNATMAATAQAAGGTLAQQVVPSGAVMAFNLSACPTGWTAYAAAGGRTIIGVNAAGGNGLSQRNLGDTPGEETHTMLVSELVSHSHTILINSAGSGANEGTWNLNWGNAGVVGSQSATPATLGAGIQNFMTEQPSGGGTPFNQMQPSVALLYCMKN